MTQIYANNFDSFSTAPDYGLLGDPDWTAHAFATDNYGIIDCDSTGLFDELRHTPRSISDDIKLIESGSPEFPCHDTSDIDDGYTSASPPEVRNYNCMWSGKCSPVDSSMCSTSPMDVFVSEAVPPAAIMCKNTITIKTEPIDENEVSQQKAKNTNKQPQSMQKIPPGTSLLINSRKTLQQQQINKKLSKITNSNSNSMHIPIISTAELLRDRSSPVFGKPETPPSLNDHDDDDNEATVFRHSCDLTACVTGSNNISLLDVKDINEIDAINRLREQLEDTDKKITSSFHGSLADVLSIIDKESVTLPLVHIKEENDKQDSTGEYDSSDDDESSVSKSSVLHFPSSNPSDSNNYPMLKHSDHSYTRCKDGIDDISPPLDTPSDSDEEIDVVSIGDKKLPTNPSDKDRRALQTKVAHKFSTARIVKTSNGIRTIPPRRRISYDLPYTPASVSPIKSGSSLVNSRYPSPTSTPYSSRSQYSSASSTSSSASSTSSTSSKYHHYPNVSSSRKRMIGSNAIYNTNSDDHIPPSKRHRGKKQKTSSNIVIKRHYSFDEVDTIEKRNLHNDMERQRRIGLKNLFEALKKQIPSIKDKERAPKVNILREAAKLCENLAREEQLLSNQKEMLKEQYRKRKELLNRLQAKQQLNQRC